MTLHQHQHQVPHRKNNLQDGTIEHLQTLIKYNHDSAEGFRSAAESLDSHVLADGFRRIADERAKQAEELSGYVAWNDGDAPEGGTVKGSLHRAWMSLRLAIQSKDEAVLAEAERGEDAIKAAYKEAIIETAGSPMSDVLHAHFGRIKRQHDVIRDLRAALSEL